MNDAEELNKLADLHARGVLSDEEFAKAKARVLNGQAAPSHGSTAGPNVGTVNSLRRARMDRWIGGVCGGIARVTGLDSWVWRLIFTVLFLAFGSGILLYILLWIFVPEE
ncbi:phage shock protein PspC (stress-responsive transcriptional regulator) [Pelomonas saccharophila]|uniref:Phage shock protein PspC (Stress-responsive transcriptional regulator) n=1 Tax=Roseateles saccharophilus TaxID=304 RepID=A0ABU1YNM0_ROSSA|nr:PspC domain-containing protein [Roseateles saccharophilus]MDR7270462.1 phage shock protein PspC (stress-responsive transcriptional regulator) [Roseateles saccharophilus]